jgi:hypothetical protein
MSERLFDVDPATGTKTWFSSSDDNGGTWSFRREADVAPVLDRNKSAQADGFDRRSEMWHAGHIPAVVIDLWRDKYGVDIFNKDHMPAVKRLLNSNEWAYLRPNTFRM